MKWINLVLGAIALVFVLILSEAVYAYYHTDPLSLYSFKISKLLAQNGNPELSFYVLTKSAGIIADRNYEIYPKVVNKEASRVILPPDNLFKQKIAMYIANLQDNSFDPKSNYDLGRLFYDLGVLAYNNGHSDLTPQFFEISVGFNPNLSYWQVELANYYLSEKQNDAAKAVLDKCMGLVAPTPHCEDYLNNNFVPVNPLKIGFLADIVANYFNSGRR